MNYQLLMIVMFIAFAAWGQNGVNSNGNGNNNTTDCRNLTGAEYGNLTSFMYNSTMYNATQNGDYAIVTCLTGYRLNNSGNNDIIRETLKCTNNEWSPLSGCQRKDCGTIAVPPNATVAFPGGTLFESTTTITCNTGYRLVGKNNNSYVFEYIQCQSNGTWNASGCELKDCGQIANVSNANVTYPSNTSFESIANVTCNTGYRLVGSTNNSDVFEHIQCQSNGTWSASRGCTPKSATSTQAPFGNATANGQDGSNSTVAATTKTWDQNGCSRLEAVWFVIAILLPVAITNF